jgi:hypothetical protein
MNAVSVGRIIPAIAPTVSYVDGAMYLRSFGRVKVGGTMGFQPSSTLRGISTDYRKFALFASVQPVDSVNLTIATAYARAYHHAQLDREAVNGNISLFTFGGFQIYGYAEVDLRKLVHGRFKISPQLTSSFVNITYRVTQMVTLGVGADASRPLYTFSVARLIPDSLRESTLRSGLSTTISLYLPGGIMLSNTYSPRTSTSRFARMYTNYTSFGMTNVLSSGVSVRTNFNLNASEYSTSNGYGASIQRNIAEIMDINVRYQQNSYTLRSYGDKHVSRTSGADLFVNVTRALAFMISYDRLQGYGIASNSIFGELSVRF